MLSATTSPPGQEASGDTELERVIGWLDGARAWPMSARMRCARSSPTTGRFLLGEIALFCVRDPARDGHVHDVLLHARRPAGHLRGRVLAAGRRPRVGSLRLGPAPQLRRRGRAPDSPGPPLDGAHLPGAIAVHMARVFFTGAFRRPRELNWLIGLGLLMLALGEGFTGYSLPDDLLSGTGLRITYSALMSIPLVGPWLASLFFGGEFPTADIISRLFVLHVLLLPGLLVGGVAAHLGLLWLQKHTQYRGGARTRGQRGRARRSGRARSSARSACSCSRPPSSCCWRPRPDQPGLAVRPVRPIRRDRPRAAGLVRGLARGCAPARASHRADHPGRHHPVRRSCPGS